MENSMQQFVVYPNDLGKVMILAPFLENDITIEEIAAKDVPEGTPYKIVEQSSLPPDFEFIDAWEFSESMDVIVNLSKVKLIAHDVRRIKRDKEFEPYDRIIMLQIPGQQFSDAESSRQTIRDKYAAIQISIDNAISIEEIKSILNSM